MFTKKKCVDLRNNQKECMKEIRFRAWDTKRKQMWWFDLLWGNTASPGEGWTGALESPSENKRTSNGRDNRTQIDLNDKIIMQYIDLKDKNGKEIYEGDIIDLWGNYIVAFEVGCFGLQHPTNSNFISFADADNSERPIKLEIIGNIYENPELLEQH